jgi:ferredoxin
MRIQNYLAFDTMLNPNRQVPSARLKGIVVGGFAQRAAECIVTFGKTHKTATWKRGRISLLDLAETQGLRIESECRAGLCGSCVTRIVSGRVGYEAEPVASIAPRKDAAVLRASDRRRAVSRRIAMPRLTRDKKSQREEIRASGLIKLEL